MRLIRDERGVTLAELLVAMVLLSIIMVPLGNALIGFVRNSDAVSRKLSESHDAQISAAYFAQDVQSVGVRDWSEHPYPLQQSIEVNAPATGGLYPCGAAGTPDAVVRFAWNDPASATAAGAVVRVAYVVVTVGAERQLRRLSCADSTTPASDIVIAHNLHTIEPVVCSTACTDADVPHTVTLTLHIRDPNNTGAPFTVVLTGQRRQT